MLAVAWTHRGRKAVPGGEDSVLHQPMYEESGAEAPENWRHTGELGGAEPIWTVRMEILEGLGLDRLRQCCDCTMCINFGGAYRRY
jgi:hypothetical protein